MGKVNRWSKILSSLSGLMKGRQRQQKKDDFNPFDIFPDWYKSAIETNATKDKETVEEKDNTTGVENYLAKKKAHKKITSTTYNNPNYNMNTKFSSPKTEQSINAPTNMGEYNDLESVSMSYADPVISTKETPTSIKMGVPRPGPSTFIQTARYNPATKQLNVQYTDGTIFPYHDVSPELADEILRQRNNHSPGQTMLGTIFTGHGTTKGDEISDIEEGM